MKVHVNHITEKGENGHGISYRTESAVVSEGRLSQQAACWQICF